MGTSCISVVVFPKIYTSQNKFRAEQEKTALVQKIICDGLPKKIKSEIRYVCFGTHQTSVMNIETGNRTL